MIKLSRSRLHPGYGIKALIISRIYEGNNYFIKRSKSLANRVGPYMICLSGMIIKNGIVLMDQIELERRNGRNLADAIKEATVNRTMAISMAALTTVLGMIPLLTDQLFDQMAATIIGGLTVASVLSLFIMPAFYRLFFTRDEKAKQAELSQHQDNDEQTQPIQGDQHA